MTSVRVYIYYWAWLLADCRYTLIISFSCSSFYDPLKTHTRISESRISNAVKRSIRCLLLAKCRNFPGYIDENHANIFQDFVSRHLSNTGSDALPLQALWVIECIIVMLVIIQTPKTEWPQISFCFVKYKTHIQTFYKYCIF